MAAESFTILIRKTLIDHSNGKTSEIWGTFG